MNFEYETERLILRILSANSVLEVLDFHQRNRTLFEKYDGRKPEDYYTVHYQQKLLDFDLQMAVQQKAFRYWIFEKAQPFTVIGTISIQRIEHGIFQTCTVGYKMDEGFHRQGFMTEALNKMISLIFSDLRLHRIEAYVKPENNASIRLLEKSGFRLEGTAYGYIFMNGCWEDHLRFSLISCPEGNS